MQLEKIERNVFFKLSRNLTFLVGSLAVLSLIISLLIFLYAVSPTSRGSRPEPPAISNSNVTLDEIKAELTKMAQKASETTTFPGVQKPAAFEQVKASTTAPAVREKTPRQKLEDKAKEIQALFPAKLYPWTNVYKTVCVQPGVYGGCWQTKQTIVKYGVSGRIDSVLRYYNVEQALSVLDELNTLVSSYPVEQRGDVLKAWAILRIEKEKAARKNFNKAERAYREAVERQRESYIASVGKKAALKPTSLMILGISFALLWQVGLILAILGVERNTRLLEEFIKASSKQQQ